MTFGNILYKSFYWRAIQMGSSFVLNILIARLLQSTNSAEFYSLLYILGLITSFFTFGLDIGLNYFIARGQLQLSTARRIIIGITVVALVAGTGLLLLFHAWLPYSALSMGILLIFAACQIAGTLLTILAGTVFTAVGQNHQPVKLAVYANGLMILLALTNDHFFTGAQAVQNIYVLYCLVSVTQGLLVFILSNRLGPAMKERSNDMRSGGIEPLRVSARFLLRFCFFSFVINFLFFIGGRIGIYLLPYNTTPAALGNYIQVFKLVEYMGLVTAFLYYPFVTLAASDEGPGSREKVLVLIRLSNTLVLLVCGLGAAVGYYIFPAVFGPSFDGMYAVFLAFIPGILALCSSSFLTAWYFGAGRIRYNLNSAIIQLGAGLLLYFLLTPSWGVSGAAWAYSGAAFASLAYDCVMFRQVHRFRLRDVLWIRQADWRLIGGFSGKLLRTSGGSAR
jgi:O-antigen/teichoic acid export membrane protein